MKLGGTTGKIFGKTAANAAGCRADRDDPRRICS